MQASMEDDHRSPSRPEQVRRCRSVGQGALPGRSLAAALVESRCFTDFRQIMGVERCVPYLASLLSQVFFPELLDVRKIL